VPLAPDKLLIEDTYYSDTPDLAPDLIRNQIYTYAQQSGWTDYSIDREELGVIPIVLAGKLEDVWPQSDAHIPRLGVRAGLFNPLTGYSLPFAAAMADSLSTIEAWEPHFVARCTRDSARNLWNECNYLRFLARMLFLGAHGPERRNIFSRFYGLPGELIGRFYAGRLTTLDKLRILVGKPPIPVMNGLKSLLPSAAKGFLPNRIEQ
jgi:lycopene beta-cyclase